MKKHFKFLFFVVVSILTFTQSSLAGHRAGGHVNYTCVAPQLYAVSFTYMLPCDDVALPNQGNVCIKPDPNLGFGTLNVELHNMSSLVEHPILFCDGPCGQSENLSYYEVTYTDTIVLDTAYFPYTIEYCDGGGRPTASNLSSGSFYTYSDLVSSVCNTSPMVVNEMEDWAFCVDETQELINNFMDPDGDSLSIFLTACLDDYQDPLYYFPDTCDVGGLLSGTNPFCSSTGWQVDPLTGNVTFNVEEVGAGPICLMVEEWRSGDSLGMFELVGTNNYEYFLTFYDCTDQFEVVTDTVEVVIPADSIMAWKTFCTEIPFVNYDSGRVWYVAEETFDLGLSGSNSLIPATFSMMDSATATDMDTMGVFCWTPGCEYEMGQQEAFFKIHDNSCPITRTTVLNVVVDATIPPQVNASFIVSGASCGDLTVEFSNVSTGANEYVWNFGDTISGTGSTSLVNPAPYTYPQSGTYDILLIAANECFSDTLLVQTPVTQTPEAHAGMDSAFCVNIDSIQLSGSILGLPGTNVAWELISGQSDGTFSNSAMANTSYFPGPNDLQSGWISLQLTAYHPLCPADTDYVTYSLYPTYQPMLMGNDTVCANTNSQYSLLPMAGVEYTWSTTCQGCITSLVNDALLNVTWPSGGGDSIPDTVSVAIMTDDGCEVVSEIEVWTLFSPEIDLGADSSICIGDTVYVDAFHPQVVSYQWQDGTTESFYSIYESGSYDVKLITQDGCTTTDTIQINVMEYSSVDLGADMTVCDNIGFALDAGNQGAIHYEWQDGSMDSLFFPTESGMYSVTVTVENECPASDEAWIEVLASPMIHLGNDTSICDSTTLMLDAEYPSVISYLWQDSSVGSTFEVFTSGNYWVVATDSNGCETTDEIEVQLNPGVTVVLGADQEICEGETVLLDASVSGNPQYLWQDGSTTAMYEVTVSGSYSVTVTLDDGCSGSDELEVTVNDAPVVNLGNDIVIEDGSSATLNAGNPGSTYSWSTGETTQTIEVTEPGSYTVIVTSPNGCTGTDQIQATLIAGIGLEMIEQSVSIYPNPALNEVFVNVELLERQKVDIELYSLEGKLLQSAPQGTQFAGSHTFHVDLNEVPVGMYLVKIVGDEFVVTKKLSRTN